MTLPELLESVREEFTRNESAGKEKKEQTQLIEENDRLKKVVAGLESQTSETYDLLGHVSAKSELDKEAKFAFEKAIKLFPDNAQAHANLGVILKKQGNYELAEKHLKKSIEISPRYLFAYDRLGGLYIKREKYPEAEDILCRALEINKKYAPAHFRLGTLHKAQGRYDLSFEEFKKAIKFDTDKNGEVTILAHNKIGEMYLDKRMYAKAKEEFSEALELDPKNEYAKKGLEEVLKGMKRAKWMKFKAEVRKKAKEAVNPLAIIISGMLLAGVLNGLIECGKVGYENFKRRQDIRGIMAECSSYFDKEDYTTAEGCYQKLLSVDPENAKVRTLLGDTYHLLGDTYYNQGEYNKAEEEYKKAIELEPDHAFLHRNLGCTYNQQKKYQEAEQEFKRAIELEPNNADSHLFIGNTYLGQGKYNEAEEEYKKAIELDPNEAYSHYGLGRTYYKIGRKNDAENQFKIFRELDAKNTQ